MSLLHIYVCSFTWVPSSGILVVCIYVICQFLKLWMFKTNQEMDWYIYKQTKDSFIENHRFTAVTQYFKIWAATIDPSQWTERRQCVVTSYSICPFCVCAASSWGKPQGKAYRNGFLHEALDEMPTPATKKSDTMQSSGKWGGKWWNLHTTPKAIPRRVRH